MTRALSATVAALAIVLVAAQSAQACSCARPPDLIAAIDQADGAFIGRLLAVRVVNPPDPGEPISSADPTDYIYRVGRVFNGGPGLHRGRRVRVRSVRDSATCGLPRARKRLYGLLVYRESHRWTSNACNVFSPAEMRAADQPRAEPSGRARICPGA